MGDRTILRREFLKSATRLGLAAASSPAWALQAFANETKPAALKSGSLGSAISFENVIKTSGISFTLDNSTQPQKYQPETMTGGVAVFD